MASIAPWSIRSIETFALWAGELWRAALGSFFDVQCRGLPLLSLRSSKRARSDQRKDAVASTNGASEMASVYWLRFILVVRRHFIMIHCVLIIVSFFSRHIRDHLKLFFRPADRASNTSFSPAVLLWAFQVIQTIGAERLTLTGRVIGSALAIWASLCFVARVLRSCSRVASKLKVLDCIHGWFLMASTWGLESPL